VTEGPRTASTTGDVVPVGLEVQVEESPEQILVRITGELDLATSPALEEKIERLGPWRATVVLDLTGVSFMDSTGLRVLWSIRQGVAEAGGKLVIGSASRSVFRVLQTTKLDKIFELAEADPAGD
jgi:anti-sigma B factor antagonist